MKTSFHHLVRRSHLYLALICLPWFVMYGISALPFSHPDWFQRGENTGIQWEVRDSWPCSLEMPDQVERQDLRKLLAVAGMDRTQFTGSRRGDTVNIYFPSFWTMERLEYKIDGGTLTYFVAEKSLQHILTGMHVRGRYMHDNFIADLWAVMVDLTALGFLLWAITGLILWMKIKPMRFWGGVSLSAGCLSFVLFMIFL